MTGTSVDGLDLALIEDSTPPKILAGRTFPLPSALRDNLLHLVHDSSQASIDLLGHSDVELGRCIGQAVVEFLNETGLSASAINAIGSHGQTVRHRPDSAFPFTMQIGDPHQIAEITGITTVADFRRRDMAAGGQGAPLVPAFHRALFQVPHETRVILNIGGIANVTHLSASAPLSGFDTGPGNGLMDLWISECLQLPMDSGGDWAAQGTVDHCLLRRALDDPYFSSAPPKSTGREYFNRIWLDRILRAAGGHLRPIDIQTTLLELTAQSIGEAIRNFIGEVDRIIVCGGGRKNQQLMARLTERAKVPVEATESHGVDGDSLEAAAFAWFGARALHGDEAGEPGVTGARGSRRLGVIFPR